MAGKMENTTQVLITNDTKKKLKELKITNRDTYNEIIIRLIHNQKK